MLNQSEWGGMKERVILKEENEHSALCPGLNGTVPQRDNEMLGADTPT